MNVKAMFLAIAVILSPIGMHAQATTPATPTTTAIPTTTAPTPKLTIGQRKENQQGRITQGVKSGQLTANQRLRLERLEHQEAGINKEQRGMRAQNNEHLTKQAAAPYSLSKMRSRAASIATSTTPTSSNFY